MQSQRTAIAVSLIIGLAIGVAVLMVLWLCAVCFSKSRTKDDDQNVHSEAKRSEQEYHPDAVTSLPEAANAPSKTDEVGFCPVNMIFFAKLQLIISVFELAPPVHVAVPIQRGTDYARLGPLLITSKISLYHSLFMSYIMSHQNGRLTEMQL